jgi:hypothetical protein
MDAGTIVISIIQVILLAVTLIMFHLLKKVAEEVKANIRKYLHVVGCHRPSSCESPPSREIDPGWEMLGPTDDP